MTPQDRPRAGSSPLRRIHDDDASRIDPGHSSDRSPKQLQPLPFQSLLGWVHRPQAITKCFISDVYQMRGVVQSSQHDSGTGMTMGYVQRELFMLHQRPCRAVEIVAWVAGVDHKEATMTLTLDDGDGMHVLPVTIRLPLVRHDTTASTSTRPDSFASTSKSVSISSNTTFSSASERRAKRKAAAEAAPADVTHDHDRKAKRYERTDVRVGDTVRIVGKVDEWMRRRASGENEWVRQVVVDENAGGSCSVVDPDTQYRHAAEVVKLHQIYANTFVLPDPSIPVVPPSSPAPAPAESLIYGGGRSMDMTSEAPSELSIVDDDIELRDPSKLRSSQLTDRTFRQYMLDHMTQETISSIRALSASHPEALRSTLELCFPEYQQACAGTSRGKGRVLRGHSSVSGGSGMGLFTDSTRINSISRQSSNPFTASTHSPDCFGSRPKSRRFDSGAQSNVLMTSRDAPSLRPFTIASLLQVERLNTLARLVVDNEARKEERRRRRRIRDGTATKKDRALEAERKARQVKDTDAEAVSGAGLMDDKERRRKMERLVSWVIRAVAEEGSLVQVGLSPLNHLTSSQVYSTRGVTEKYGFLPLPPELLIPLCIPHFENERFVRENSIMRKTDPRYGSGMSVDDLTSRLRRWGEEGRWERLGDWIVEEAVEYAAGKKWVRQVGKGWWLVDGFDLEAAM